MSISRRKLLANAAAAGAATLVSHTTLAAANRHRLLLIAHHGAGQIYPENTIVSCECALKQGATAIEIDICFTKDRHPILWHDWSPDAADALARQIGLQPDTAYRPVVPSFGSRWRKPVDALDLADIRAHFSYERLNRNFDCESRCPPPLTTQPPIPTFFEFFSWARNQRGLDYIFLDIKMPACDKDRAPAMLDAIYRAMPSRNRNHPKLVFMVPEEKVLVELLAHDAKRGYKSTFSWDIELPPIIVLNPKRFSAIDHAVKKCLTVASVGRPTAVTLFPWSTYAQVMDYDIQRWKEVNSDPKNRPIKSLIAWTINHYDEMEYLARAGVSGIITDDIPALKCAAKAARRHT